MSSLLDLDFFLTKLIYSLIPHNLFFNSFFSFFSLRGNSIFIWVMVILIAFTLEEHRHPGIQKRDLAFVGSFLFSFFITSFVVNSIVKPVFQRPRPSFPTAPVGSELAQCPTDYSFPSGHASTAFAAATTITFFDKKRRWFYYTIAILISLSRIYLGCHYFLDVVFGAIIGYLISKAILNLSRNF